MTDNKKRFPLSLSSLNSKPSANNHSTSGKTASLQTASRNVARGIESKVMAPANVATAAARAAASSSLGSERARKAMVERVAAQGVKDGVVLAAMESIPRHLFMEPALASQAYIDASLPIGCQQTISQPYIVARMIEIMRNNANAGKLERVLEIGTGCGYQAAVLSRVAKEVYSIERIRFLHELAKGNLRALRIPNLRLHYGDGMLGLPQAAPFDGIILAAAGMDVPQALLEQLSVGGRLIAPVGGEKQVLKLIERTASSRWKTTVLEDCHFVPLRPGILG